MRTALKRAAKTAGKRAEMMEDAMASWKVVKRVAMLEDKTVDQMEDEMAGKKAV